MLYGDIPVFTYHIAYPSFSTPCVLSAARTANIYYMQLAENTEQYCRTILYPQAAERARYIPANYPPFNRYTLDMNYQITYNSCLLYTSINFDTFLWYAKNHFQNHIRINMVLRISILVVCCHFLHFPQFLPLFCHFF